MDKKFIIIAGGRDFDDYALLERKCDIILNGLTDIIIRSGKARGADTLGEEYAKKRGYPIDPCPADWERYGRSAGHRRNAEMAKGAFGCIVFWDGKSRGSGGMIDIAKKNGIQVRVIMY